MPLTRTVTVLRAGGGAGAGSGSSSGGGSSGAGSDSSGWLLGRLRAFLRLRLGSLELGVLAQDRLVQLAEVTARLDAELLDEVAARCLVDLERVGVAAGAVEGEHKLGVGALAERLLPGQRLELAHELGMAAEREVGIDPSLQAGQAELLQAGDLGLREGLVAEVGEGLATPERQRLAQRVRRFVGPSLVELPPRLVEELLEQLAVALLGSDAKQVPGRLGQQTVIAAESLAQARNRHLQRVRAGRTAAPELFDQPLRGHRLVRVYEQVGEQRPLARTAKLDRAIPVDHLERPQNTELHGSPPGRRIARRRLCRLSQPGVRMKSRKAPRTAREPGKQFESVWTAPACRLCDRSDPTTRRPASIRLTSAKTGSTFATTKEVPMRVVLVTGCSSGIGMHAALAFARQGDRVYATMRDPSKGGALTAAAAAEGLSVTVAELDVTKDDSVRKAVGQVLEAEGRDRRPCEQRRHHTLRLGGAAARGAGARDLRDEPVRRSPHDPGGSARDASPGLRVDRQRLVARRPCSHAAGTRLLRGEQARLSACSAVRLPSRSSPSASGSRASSQASSQLTSSTRPRDLPRTALRTGLSRTRSSPRSSARSGRGPDPKIVADAIVAVAHGTRDGSVHVLVGDDAEQFTEAFRTLSELEYTALVREYVGMKPVA